MPAAVSGKALTRMTWEHIQDSIRTCRKCLDVQGSVFQAFQGDWPMIPPPPARAFLFISEAPPKDGGFWAIQSRTSKQDDLREKLLPLLKLAPGGSDRGLTDFRDAGYFLLQSFPRPLKISLGGAKTADIVRLLRHPVKVHLQEQIDLFTPSAILALGRPASAALCLLFPESSFARSFQGDDFPAVQGRMFRDPGYPLLSATYLPSGNGRFWQRYWAADIPRLVREARSLLDA